MQEETHETPAGKDDKKTLKGLEDLNLDNIDGVNYFRFALQPDLSHVHACVRKIHIRPDDVITIGFPRSGNHWTFEMVSMIQNQTTDFEKDHFYSRILEYLGSEVATTVHKMASPRNLTTHCRIHHIPEEAILKRTKLIYVLRNPKDVLVSLYNLVSSLSDDGCAFMGSWGDFFDLQMKGAFPWGYWFDHVLATEAFIRDHPESPVFVLVYEKMKENPVEHIRRLCSFLGKPDTLSERIANKTQFAAMKLELGRTKMLTQSSNHFKNGPNDILRKGVVRDWRNWFTPSQSESFNKLFETKMAGSKLGQLVREYMD